jgi:hypothetical protein
VERIDIEFEFAPPSAMNGPPYGGVGQESCVTVPPRPARISAELAVAALNAEVNKLPKV